MAALILICRLLTPPAVLSTDSRAQSQSNMRGEPVSRILSRSTPLPAQSWAIIHLGGLLPGPSSCQPEPAGLKRPICGSYLALLPVGLALPPLLPEARWAFTPPFHPFRSWPQWRTIGMKGGFISVALSVGLPRPGVTRHRYFWESGLSSTLLPAPRPSSLPRKAGLAGRNGAVNGYCAPNAPRMKSRPPRGGPGATAQTADARRSGHPQRVPHR